MAEAVVEDRPGPQPRFYCHVCKQEFTNITTEYTCPVCSDGFIEELHDADPSPSSNASNIEVDVLELLNSGFRGAMPTDGSGGSGQGGLPAPFRLLRQQAAAAADPRGRRRAPPHHHHHHHHHHPQQRMGPPTHPAATGATADGSGGPAMIQAYDQLIRDFFAYVGVPGVSGAPGPNGRRVLTTGANGRADQLTLTPMFFIGNPGDYVWGHDGLDSVITLMLNQLEPTGPPPMSAQKIDEIPKWVIGSEELDKKMQCSVCLEDFQMQEQCRKLACAHIFHESCIVPWLELHGTCPICRDTFTEGGEGAEEGDNQMEDMETDGPPSSRFEIFLDDQNLPRTVSSSESTAGIIGSSVGVNPTSSSSSNSGGGGRGAIGSSSNHINSSSNSNNNSHAMSSQSATTAMEATTNNANEGGNRSNNRNMNFHLDDGLD